MSDLCLLVVPVVLAACVGAQSPSYVRRGSIGKASTTDTRKGWHQYPYLSIEEWEGKRVIFLPKPLSLQAYGYQSFVGGSGELGQPTYEEAAGKIGTIELIEKGRYPKVTIRMEESGKKYVGTVTDNLEGIAFLDEIDLAKKEFIGKTLWLRHADFVTYNATTGNYGPVKTKRYSPVNVTDVVVGFESPSPVRFILRSQAGEEGFHDVNLSGTNAFSEEILREHDHFDTNFLMTDPRKQYPWTPRVWNAIENEEVFVGMTEAQVKMSWGEPLSTNRTVTQAGETEQWVFRGKRLAYVSRGVMISAQN